MITSNAGENAPMLAINARVGFTVYRRFVEYQIPRAALDSWRSGLAARRRLRHHHFDLLLVARHHGELCRELPAAMLDAYVVVSGCEEM